MDDSTIRDILENKIVLIVPKGGEKLSSFEELTKDSIENIGIGDPGSVPAGQYADQVLQSLGLIGKIKDKLVFCKRRPGGALMGGNRKRTGRCCV